MTGPKPAVAANSSFRFSSKPPDQANIAEATSTGNASQFSIKAGTKITISHV
jgi:hypothetical protein